MDKDVAGEVAATTPAQRREAREGAGAGWAQRMMRELASLRVTLVLIVMFALGLVIAFRFEHSRVWPMVVPLALLLLNLLAAIATNAVFRRQMPLLVFHLSLAVVLLLVSVGRLTYLKGFVGVTDGAVFDGVLAVDERGPLHAGVLETVRFANAGFTIDYAPGWQRGATRNYVRVQTPDGRWERQVVGDHNPLVTAGYRFYTTFNKGFAPTFEWQSGDEPALYGSVQLPSYPLNEYVQAVQWTPPGSDTVVWVMLDIDEIVIDPEDYAQFRLPETYQLIVRVDDQRHAMQPGDTLALSDGTLTFVGLRSWMGYRVFYDWTLPWLLAACAVGVLSLGAHFWQRFAAKPWDA